MNKKNTKRDNFLLYVDVVNVLKFSGVRYVVYNVFIFSQCYDLDRGKEIKQNARCIFLISSLL